MAKKPADFTTDYFSIRILDRSTRTGANYIKLHAGDRFSKPRHALERKTFSMFTRGMEAYLRRRPHLDFDHPKNPIRRIVYFPSALKAWAAYMPGGFATFHVHNPDRKRLKSGENIDYITRNLFRHSSDAIGLRSRAYAMAWFIHDHFKDKSQVSWLSIACGTGQPTFEAARLLKGDVTFHLCDLDIEALEFATKLAKEYGISDEVLYTHRNDLRKKDTVETLMKKTQPTVIEAMGLFEYLDDDEAVTLLKRLRKGMKKESVLVFTNMRSAHPQLQIHKRGLGWPGVIPRTVNQVRVLMDKAGFTAKQTTVLLPDDDVYAVYCLTA